MSGEGIQPHLLARRDGLADDARKHLEAAVAYRVLGDSEGERRALEKLLALNQNDLSALIRLAELHERLGEEALAANRWHAVIALSSNVEEPSAEFLQLVAHAQDYVQNQRRDLADEFERALSDDLSHASARDRRRMQTATDLWLGKRPLYASHCLGLHYPFLPADEFFDRELFPWFTELEAATPYILAELEAILRDPEPGLTPYLDYFSKVPSGTPGGKWSKLDRSLDWGAFHLWKEGVRFDEACARAPATAAVIEALPMCRIPGRAPNAFFSILKAGSHIPAHTGVTNVRSVVHMGLIVPDGCEFRVGGETRAWRRGEAFAFDDTMEHEAWNRSGLDRAVLIIDAWNPHLSEHEQAMVCRLYEAADRQNSAIG